MAKDLSKNGLSVVADVLAIIEEGRKKAYRAVNTAMVEAYWLAGKRIVEEEQDGEEHAEYGKSIINALSKELNLKYGSGYSPANLRNFRQFYLTYPIDEICYTVCSKLSWSHNRLIMRVPDSNTRSYPVVCKQIPAILANRGRACCRDRAGKTDFKGRNGILWKQRN